MDDSFAYRTTLPAGPRVQPWVIKTAVVSILLVLGVGLFARWVVMSERESFARGYHPVLPSLEVGQIEGTADLPGTDDEAREATRVALAAARAAAAEGGSFLAADPVTLSTLQPGYTFVDGPSTIPEIVSVAGNRRAWAAAVLGPTGTCFWIRAEAGGPVASGTSSVCTGAVILKRSAFDDGARPVAASR